MALAGPGPCLPRLTPGPTAHPLLLLLILLLLPPLQLLVSAHPQSLPQGKGDPAPGGGSSGEDDPPGEEDLPSEEDPPGQEDSLEVERTPTENSLKPEDRPTARAPVHTHGPPNNAHRGRKGKQPVGSRLP